MTFYNPSAYMSYPSQQTQMTLANVNNAFGNLGQNSISNTKNQITNSQAAAGNPVSQSILAQQQGQTQQNQQPASFSSALLSPLQGQAAGFDNSGVGRVINGIAGNAPGNGYGQQAYSSISSLFQPSANPNQATAANTAPAQPAAAPASPPPNAALQGGGASASPLGAGAAPAAPDSATGAGATGMSAGAAGADAGAAEAADSPSLIDQVMSVVGAFFGL
jgi:hypothetical protein